MFKKLVKELLAAKTEDDIQSVLYGSAGADMMFQKEKIKWDEHEMLFDLAAKLEIAMCANQNKEESK